MQTLAQLICQPTVNNDRKLKKICEPLSKGFGLDIFWHYSLTSEGEFSYIGNDSPSAEYFFSHSLYQGHPYFKDPKLLQSGFFFADKMATPDYIQTQGRLRDQVFSDQLFVVMNVSEKKAEGYGFATTKKLPDLTNTFINNLFLLRKFINYFHNETQHLLPEMKKSSVDIAAQCRESFFKPTNYFDTLTSPGLQQNFLKEIDPLRYEVIRSLSSREKECLRWFLKGLSAVQIGKKIHLSNRTVEFYIENVKNKLGCNTKQELFDTLLNSRDFLTLTFF